MIDPQMVKSFWETRSEKLNKLPFESIANLEEKADLLQLKITLEQEKILPLLPLNPNIRILDLGAGVGQWTFRFAPFVKEVTAVEYMDSFTQIAMNEANKQGLTNIKFVTNAAECYQSNTPFDIVFISGLFVYLNPDQAQQLMANLTNLLKKNGLLLVRDGTSILNHAYHINNHFSDILKENYSAFYRTRAQYITLFQNAGFKLIKDGQMFDEGCPLNKFIETRLRFYLFQHQ